MIINVDARGCACPEPVIRTKNAIEREHDSIIVLVDNKTALENVMRFANKNKHSVDINKKENYYEMILKA